MARPYFFHVIHRHKAEIAFEEWLDVAQYFPVQQAHFVRHIMMDPGYDIIQVGMYGIDWRYQSFMALITVLST